MTEAQAELAGQTAAPPPNRTSTRFGLSLVLAFVFGIAALWLAPPQPWTVDAFVPVEHRAPVDRQLLWITSRPRADATGVASPEAASARTDALRAAALAIGNELGPARLQLAAAPADSDAWLDAHALYLLPPSEHAALGARLEQDAMLRAVQDLHARLSSPIFGLTGEDSRRDPLGVRALLTPFMQGNGEGWASGARPTPTGDLMSANGQELVMEVRGIEADLLKQKADTVLSSQGLDNAGFAMSTRVVGFAGVPAAPAPAWGSRPGLALLAAFALGLIIARRDLFGVLLCLACACAGVALGALVGAPWGLDVSAMPPFALAAGALALASATGLCATTICDAQPPSGASVLALALAAVPTLALPYPFLRGLAGPWALCIASAALLAGLVRARRPPDAETPVGASSSEVGASGVRRVAATLGLALGLAATGWFTFQSPARAIGAVQDPERAAAFATAFFDPQMIVEVRSEGTTPVQALEHAAQAHPALRQTLAADPAKATSMARIDGPGAYLIAPELLAHRRKGLSELKLGQRMQALRNMLEGQGFRPEAFSEFLAGSADIAKAPDAQAALDGQLGRWISARIDSDENRSMVRTRIHLSKPQLVAPIDVGSGEQTRVLRATGPAQHLAIDQQQTQARLALALATAAWVIALLAWLVHRQLGRALFVAAAGCVGAGLGLAAAWWDAGVYDATALLPLCAVMGLCAFEANEAMARTTNASNRGGHAVFARSLALVVGAAWMAAQADPWAHRWGLVLLVGAGIGSGFAYFVARFGYGSQPPVAPSPTGDPNPPKSPGEEDPA